MISMSISIGGPLIPIDVFATPPTPTATSWSTAGADLAGLNALLAASGSEYQFVTLGGSSNFPGTASQGNLVLTGEIHSVVGGGPFASLTVVETETGFTSPGPGPGMLMSSSTGNFTNQPAGGGHTASSDLSGTPTPTYAVLSSDVAVNPEGGVAAIGVAIPIPYTMTNTITFSLSPATVHDIVDSFGVTATVALAPIPEPSSWVMFLTGVPLPVVLVGLLRRHRRAAARS